MWYMCIYKFKKNDKVKLYEKINFYYERKNY